MGRKQLYDNPEKRREAKNRRNKKYYEKNKQTIREKNKQRYRKSVETELSKM